MKEINQTCHLDGTAVTEHIEAAEWAGGNKGLWCGGGQGSERGNYEINTGAMLGG